MRESRVGPRRRLRFAATVAGIGEDGKVFEEKAVVRDITLYGAYLSLSNRPPLQSELHLVIEANAADNHPSLFLSAARWFTAKPHRKNTRPASASSLSKMKNAAALATKIFAQASLRTHA